MKRNSLQPTTTSINEMLKKQQYQLENPEENMIEEIIKLQHEALNNLSDKVIFAIIRNRSQDKEYYPISLNNLAAMSGLTVRSVSKIIRKLKDNGLIETLPKSNSREVTRYKSVAF
ncbi:helix-turn-helix domain-containing protein [Pseudomonas aeruginosa]|nr:helix-turn-helix domain-containing protein [Pseudomonas aeruginosa]MDF5861334.1 helix-turn-helix domain-containing protein [Pseudomonas aeruginosa]MDF5924015.1 helix-turn-helix domain-containing protein [Pseudomonas aeruginosa]